MLEDSYAYRLLFETSAEGMLLAADDGEILDANPEACRILQRAREEITEAGLEVFFDPSDPRLGRGREEWRKTGKFKGELRLLRGDGAPFLAQASIVRCRDSDGKGISGITFRDIAERKRAEEELRKSEAQFRIMVENALDLIALCNPDNTFRYINAAVEQILGYRPEELLGTVISDLIHPEDLEQFVEENVREIQSGSVSVVGPIEIRWRRKDGSYRLLESYINNLIYDPDVRGVVGTARDVTERKLAEEEIRRLNETLESRVAERTAQLETLVSKLEAQGQMLRESEEQFRTTFDQAAVGIAHVAPDGRWLRVNKKLCEIVGYSEEELLSRTFQDITHSDDLENDLDHLRRMLAGEIDTYSVEKRYIKKDYSKIWVDLRVALVREPSGEPKYLISVVEDITERKQREMVLRSLTPREIEVLKLLAQGCTNKEIAEAMVFSVSTVKNHVQQIITKLGASDRTQAAVRAVELGLIDPKQ